MNAPLSELDADLDAMAEECRKKLIWIAQTALNRGELARAFAACAAAREASGALSPAFCERYDAERLARCRSA